MCVCMYCYMTPKSRNRRSLLGNYSVKAFPQQRIHKQQASNFRCYAMALKTRLPNNGEAVFSAWSVQSGYKEKFIWEELFEFRDSLLGYELRSKWIELSLVFGIGSYGVVVRKKLGCENISCVIWSYSEAVINPLPWYDYWRLRTLVRMQRSIVTCVGQQ
jgi:hypothetical protein